jgi:hypothetical protein
VYIYKAAMQEDVVEAYNVEDPRRCETDVTKTDVPAFTPMVKASGGY